MTVGDVIYEKIIKNPGTTASEIRAGMDKIPQHIYNELGGLESMKKITVDRTVRPYRYYPIGEKSDGITIPETAIETDYVAEFDTIIREVTKAAGRPIESGYEIIDRGMPHTPGSLKRGTMGVYTFLYKGEFLKIGKAGPHSNARFESQHYIPRSSNSNLSKSILKDPEMQALGLTESNVGEWIRKNTRRIDVLIDSSHGIFTLELIEAALHYRFEPRYEGYNNQR